MQWWKGFRNWIFLFSSPNFCKIFIRSEKLSKSLELLSIYACYLHLSPGTKTNNKVMAKKFCGHVIAEVAVCSEIRWAIPLIAIIWLTTHKVIVVVLPISLYSVVYINILFYVILVYILVLLKRDLEKFIVNMINMTENMSKKTKNYSFHVCNHKLFRKYNKFISQ